MTKPKTDEDFEAQVQEIQRRLERSMAIRLVADSICLFHPPKVFLGFSGRAIYGEEVVGLAANVVDKKITLSETDQHMIEFNEGQAGGLEQRDQESQGTAEDRRKAVGPSEEVREQGKMG